MKFKNQIQKRIRKKYELENIEKIKNFPFKANYITWSAGWELESEFRYKLNCRNKNGEIELIYCELTTLLGIIPLQFIFFKELETKMEQIIIKK